MNIHDSNNRGFLALKLNRAAGKKKETGVSIAKALGIHSTTACKILRGEHASMEMYGKVAEYLGVPMKPEKSLLSHIVAHRDDFVGIGAASILDALETHPKKLTKEEIVQAERETIQRIKATAGSNGTMSMKLEGSTDGKHWQEMPMQTTYLPAPIVQDSFTEWQAWVIMALQVVVILFLIFPTRW